MKICGPEYDLIGIGKMIRYEQTIARRIEKIDNRKLAILGDDYFTSYIYKDAEKMGLKPIRIDIDHFNLTPDEFFVLVPLFSGHKSYYDLLMEKGFRYNVDFSMTSMSGYCKELNTVDPLLSYGRVTEEGEQYEVIGEGTIKIAILGSSTSELQRNGQRCWPCFLHEYLYEKGINTSIYVGAISGYSSGQEALKIFRDITSYDFDMVISFSGVNDGEVGNRLGGYSLYHKYQKRMWENVLSVSGIIPDSLDMRNLNSINWGRKENSSDAKKWADNQRRIKAICNEFDVQFIAFLEPMIAYYDSFDTDLMELLMNAGVGEVYFAKQKKFCEEVKAQELQFMVDLTQILRNKKDVYIDHIHCNEYGNRIIAKTVCDFILIKLGE